MNFSDVWTWQQAEDLAPPSAVTQEARQRQRELEQRLLIIEREECPRLEWVRRFREDVATEFAFFAEKAEMKEAQKEAKKKEKEEKATTRKDEQKKKAPVHRPSPLNLPPPSSSGRRLRCHPQQRTPSSSSGLISVVYL
jgi:hypothetical protein